MATAVSPPPPPFPISPTYSTLLGAEAADAGYGLGIDRNGRAVVTGHTQSITFPTRYTGATPLHGIDVYATRLAADGRSADYSYWFNALTLYAEDTAYAIAVTTDGSPIITGDTRSADFCTLFGAPPGYDPSYNGNGDVFVLKINASGDHLDYCTFLGGEDGETGRAITIDTAGRAIIGGGVWSTDFPTTPDALFPSHNGLRDGFIARLSADGTQLEYASFLGGSGQEEVTAVSQHPPTGDLFLGGWSFSSDFPTTPLAYDTTPNGLADGFALRLTTTGDTLLYSTYLGTAGDDRVTGVAITPAGEMTLVGYSDTPTFPTTPGAFDTTHNGTVDGFALQLTNNGRSLVYSTFLGGNQADWGEDVAVDGCGQVWVTGRTWSTDYPTTPDAFATTLSGERNAFITRLAATGTAVHYSSYLGGSDWDHGLALAADALGRVWITGETRSTDFPTTTNAFDETPNGDYDIFVTNFDLRQAPTLTLTLTGPTTGTVHTAYDFTATLGPALTPQPFVYTWQVGGETAVSHAHCLTDQQPISGNTPGTYPITITASNGLITHTHTLTLTLTPHSLFLPLISQQKTDTGW